MNEDMTKTHTHMCVFVILINSRLYVMLQTTNRRYVGVIPDVSIIIITCAVAWI